MENRWENFWKSGRIEDYLNYCSGADDCAAEGRKQDSFTMENVFADSRKPDSFAMEGGFTDGRESKYGVRDSQMNRKDSGDYGAVRGNDGDGAECDAAWRVR